MNFGFFASLKDWDFAKMSLILYITGIFVSLLYFSQLSILSLDFAKPQAILIGVYCWGYFFLIPQSFIRFLSWVKTRLKFTITFFIIFLVIKAFMCVWFLGISSYLFPLFDVLLELLFFLDLKLWLLRLSPTKKSYSFFLAFSALFAFFLFPQIPSYLGGAKPLEIEIKTKPDSLLYSRFSKSKTRLLLYESDDELYLMQNIKTDGILLDIQITRIKKENVLSIKYKNPVWVSFK